MARTTALTVETVAAAAAELQAAGRSVTVAAVTEIIGGSYTTVGRLLREWRGEAPAAPQAADGEPQEIPAAVARALAAVGPAVAAALAEARAEETRSREAAVSALRAEADRDRQTAAAVLAEARADLDALAEHADRLQADLDAAQARAQAAEDARRTAEADRDALARQVAALTEQVVAAKTQAARGGASLDGAEGQDLADCVARLVGLVSDHAPATLAAWADEMSQPDGDRDRLAGGIAALRSLWDGGADGVERDIAQARQRQVAARKIKGGVEIDGKVYTVNVDNLLRDGERTGAYVRRQGGPSTGGTVWAVGLHHRSDIAVTTHPTRADGIAAAAALLAAQP